MAASAKWSPTCALLLLLLLLLAGLAGHSVDDQSAQPLLRPPRWCWWSGGLLNGAGGVEVLPARVLLSSPFPPGVCAFPPGVCAFLLVCVPPLPPSRPPSPFCAPRRQDGGGGVEVLLLKHQSEHVAVPLCKRSSPPPQTPSTPLHPPSTTPRRWWWGGGCQDGGGGVEVLPLEHQSAHCGRPLVSVTGDILG
ncbi:unnamed protein product [Closterium sp. NIES-64]|nr:unnamed protein product [Closterium sp. NIES-64]